MASNETKEEGRQMVGAGTDLLAAASGGGYSSCPEGVPVEIGLLSILAAFGVAFGILYRALTIKTARRRRKRELGGEEGECEAETIDGFLGCRIGQLVGGAEGSAWYQVADLVWHGLEEFEEKIDSIADGEDAGDDSWISKIYNQFSFFNDGDNSLAEADMDGLEPPILDETWGLGVRKTDILENKTVEEPDKPNTEGSKEETSQTKRKDENEEEHTGETEKRQETSEREDECMVDMWRCLSQVIEGGLLYLEKPQGLLGLAKKTMFNIVLQGGLGDLWGGVMTVPEARAVKHCMTSHSECLSDEILRKEAQVTLDPTDPAYSMYDRETGTMGETQEAVSQGKEEKESKRERKRERLIVIPEFVESLDTGDGSVQYDEDYTENHI